MVPEAQVEPRSSRLGWITLTCRVLCSALVASPLINYVSTVSRGGGGNACLFFLLVVLAPIAGLVLIANPVCCLFRYRNGKSFLIARMFVLVGMIGLLDVWFFLPKFRT